MEEQDRPWVVVIEMNRVIGVGRPIEAAALMAFWFI